MKPSTAYIGAGSNLGDRRGTIRQAVALLGETAGVTVLKVSDLFETEPVGGPPQGPFLNGAVEIRTTRTPQELLDILLGIESQLGRERSTRWGPRTIDLDLLIFGDTVVNEPRLTIPHPRMHERLFVLKPLCDIAPELRHPVSGQRVLNMLEESTKESGGTHDETT